MTAAPEKQTSTPARVCGVALWLLLAGYLLFNKPFATLGIAPVFVGEVVFAAALGAGLLRWRETFLEPLRNSWGFRILGALWVYAVIHALWGAMTYGILAFRDGAMIGYGLLAFLAPALWRELSKFRGDAQSLAAHVAGWLLPLGLLAVIASAGVLFGWWPHSFNARVKVDFAAVAGAAGAWISLVAGLKWAAVGGYYSRARGRDRVYRWVLVAFYFVFALWAWSLVFRLPTRAVFVSFVPLALLLIAARLNSVRLRIAGAIALAMLIGATLFLARERLASMESYTDRFALNQHLNLPLHDLEARTARALAGDLSGVPEDIRTRFELLLPAHDQALAKGPNFGEHSLRWRMVFWLRCWNYTLANAPVTGLGFGGNMTALMLPTRAWPDYVHSQQMTPPNRSPHGVHIHIFTRLGLLGTALWFALLALTMNAALRALWHWRTPGDRPAREAFYDTLTVLGFWIVLLCAASFGVIIEGPFGGMWFWALTGVLLSLQRSIPEA